MNSNSENQKTITKRGQATECLFKNFDNREDILHYYIYLGSNNHERERIQKKLKRWDNHLAALPATERNALLNTLIQPEL